MSFKQIAIKLTVECREERKKNVDYLFANVLEWKEKLSTQ